MANRAYRKEKISINLFDENSITNAIGELNRFKRQHDARVDLFLRKLTERGVEIAKAKIIDYNAVFTAEMFNSLHLEPRGNKAYAVISDSEHTAFVEFGTGQMGEEGSYPYPFPDGVAWEYNVGETIFEISEGQYGWFYPALDGTWKFTQGMPSRPFMYETFIDLNDAKIIREVAKEVFG